jgi:hypothetical protein
MKTYTLTGVDHNILVNAGQEMSIVVTDPAHVEGDYNPALWEEYQAWLAKGNTPEPYVEPVIPPPATVAQKLDSMGITIADLKAELGIA